VELPCFYGEEVLTPFTIHTSASIKTQLAVYGARASACKEPDPSIHPFCSVMLFDRRFLANTYTHSKLKIICIFLLTALHASRYHRRVSMSQLLLTGGARGHIPARQPKQTSQSSSGLERIN
jgi:hypothetical protein